MFVSQFLWLKTVIRSLSVNFEILKVNIVVGWVIMFPFLSILDSLLTWLGIGRKDKYTLVLVLNSNCYFVLEYHFWHLWRKMELQKWIWHLLVVGSWSFNPVFSSFLIFQTFTGLDLLILYAFKTGVLSTIFFTFIEKDGTLNKIHMVSCCKGLMSYILISNILNIELDLFFIV